MQLTFGISAKIPTKWRVLQRIHQQQICHVHTPHVWSFLSLTMSFMKTLNSFLCRTCDKFYDVSCSMLTSMCWKRRPGWNTCLSWWDRRLKTAAWPSHRSSSMVLNTEQNLSRQRTISSTWLKESCEEAKEEVHVQIQAPPERTAQNHLPKEQPGGILARWRSQFSPELLTLSEAEEPLLMSSAPGHSWRLKLHWWCHKLTCQTLFWRLLNSLFCSWNELLLC